MNQKSGELLKIRDNIHKNAVEVIHEIDNLNSQPRYDVKKIEALEKKLENLRKDLSHVMEFFRPSK